METFLAAWYGKLSAFLGAVAVLWGGAKAFGALKKWCADKYGAYVSRRDAPAKMLAAMEQMKAEQDKRDAGLQQQIEKLSARFGNMEQSIADVKKDILENGDQMATVQNEKLNWAYVYYGCEQHPIPYQTKCSLEQMYEDYHTRHMRNHIPEDWKEKIESAPVE